MTVDRVLIKENESEMSHNLSCNVNERCKSHSQALLKKKLAARAETEIFFILA